MTSRATIPAPEARARIFKVAGKLAPAWQRPIAALEGSARYPLGSDSFRLDHGADYFAFFERLGVVHYYAARVGDRAVAVGAGILRRVPYRAGQEPRKTWYLCDLKVHPAHRGRHLPLRLLGRAFLPCYLRCTRGYAISMNPPEGKNRVVRLLERFRWVPIRYATELEIFSMDVATMKRLRPIVERHRGPISFLSLRGKKDLVLESTGAPLALLHVQHGACAEPGEPRPVAGHTHMICSPAGDPLGADLRANGVAPSATASIVQHGMDDSDWKFVLTSDI